MKRVKIGVVGAGANTRLRHIPGFQSIEGVSVEVVCNRSAASSRSVAEAFGIARIAESWEAVVNDPEIDAVCIGTWPYLHAPVSIAALAAGKHVLTEARLAMNAEEAERMVAASRARSDLVAQVVPSPFTLKWDATVRKILASGELGDLREIHFSKALGLNVDGESPLNWRQSRELSGNNVMMLGIYYEVVLRWLGLEPKRVLAHGAIFTKERRASAGGLDRVAVAIPETVSVLAEYENGLRLTGRMSGLELGAATDEYVISGSRGTLRLDLRAGKLTVTKLGGSEQIVEPALEGQGSWQVEADFVESIRSGKAVTLTSFQDGLAYMRFTDAALRSMESDGAWVGL